MGLDAACRCLVTSAVESTNAVGERRQTGVQVQYVNLDLSLTQLL